MNIKIYFFTLLASLFSLWGQEVESTVILGGGVGALSSAIYLGRAGIKPLVIEGSAPGGLISQSHLVENWPGEMKIEGMDLVEKIRNQAIASGARLVSEEVIGVDFSKRPFLIRVRSCVDQKERVIQAKSCIIAMGTTPNFLSIPGESTFWGRGVTNCAVCDGALYRNKVVGVVGGGDAAVLEALYLSDIAKEVNLLVRKGSFRATETERLKTLLKKKNVHVFYNTTVEKVLGQEMVTGVLLRKGEKEFELSVDGLFLAIGSTPNTQIFKNVLDLDSSGYIQLESDQETAIPGVYAIGDIVDPVYKQAISAAGDGAKAALQATHFLSQPQKPEEVIEIVSTEQFEREIKESEVPIIVDFYATWCPPCKKLSPIFHSSAEKHFGKAKFLKVNVDQFPELAESFQIRAMPTVLILDKEKKVLERKTGTDHIVSLLDRISSKDLK